MKTKKHPKANLENYSKLFAQLGLVLSLLIVYVLIQNKTFEKNIKGLEGRNLTENFTPEQNIEYIIEQIKVQPIKKPQVLIDIKREDNDSDKEEDVFQIIDVDLPIEEPKFIEVIEDDTIDENDGVPIILVEEAPLFPGCKGTKEEKKACFTKQIGRFVNRKFNSNLAEELGLSSGIQRIHTLFKIDKNGYIVDVKAKAPHKRLQQEAIRIINLLPKMEPGKQQGKSVVVKFALPITFKIQ